MKYFLSKSQADRIRFDEDARRFFYSCLAFINERYMITNKTELFNNYYDTADWETDDDDEADARARSAFDAVVAEIVEENKTRTQVTK